MMPLSTVELGKKINDLLTGISRRSAFAALLIADALLYERYGKSITPLGCDESQPASD
jgi:hypothetical protein